MDALVIRVMVPARVPCGFAPPIFASSRLTEWMLAMTAVMVFLVWPRPMPASAARYRTTNFTVDAPTSRLAKEIGNKAEYWRQELAFQWLGENLPPWSRACPIKARVSSRMGAGGATSFVFDSGEVFKWDMQIQGSEQRILDSVLPHEITHTIFASHFRRPLPRWADEGACTTMEHVSEISRQEALLIEHLKTRRGIPFSVMFAMKDYPEDVLPLYTQGHSLAQFLIPQYGKRHFLDFLADGMEDENWPRAMRKAYGYQDLLVLQNSWLHWIRQGRPTMVQSSASTLVAARAQSARSEPAWSQVRNALPGQDLEGQSSMASASRGPYHVGSRAMQGSPSATLALSSGNERSSAREILNGTSQRESTAPYAASSATQQNRMSGKWRPVSRPSSDIHLAKAKMADRDTQPIDPAVRSTSSVTWPLPDRNTRSDIKARSKKSVYDASGLRATVRR